MEKMQITSMQKIWKLWKQSDLRDPSHQMRTKVEAAGKTKKREVIKDLHNMLQKTKKMRHWQHNHWRLYR